MRIGDERPFTTRSRWAARPRSPISLATVTTLLEQCRPPKHPGRGLFGIVLRSLLLVSFIVLTTLAGSAQAETRYVTDTLAITLRTGESNSYRVLKTLPSGTKLELISNNDENGYSLVETPSGEKGYVLTRYLMTEKPAKVLLNELRKEVERLRTALHTEPRKLVQELRRKYQSLQLNYDSLQFENSQISQNVAAIKDNAANVVKLMNERDSAQQRANSLSTQLDKLKVRNGELEHHSDKKWFMVGAAVLLAGVLVGLILPRIGGQRRGRWSNSNHLPL